MHVIVATQSAELVTSTSQWQCDLFLATRPPLGHSNPDRKPHLAPLEELIKKTVYTRRVLSVEEA